MRQSICGGGVLEEFSAVGGVTEYLAFAVLVPIYSTTRAGTFAPVPRVSGVPASERSKVLRASISISARLNIFHDRSALHHELHLLKDGHVAQRVTLHGDDVCILSGFDGTDAVLPT